MKTVFLTQRVDIIKSYGERRDALDRKWSLFLRNCGCLIYPLPNDIDSVMEIMGKNSTAGIVLTGGNNLAAYGGDAPERDMVEGFLIEYAVKNDIPLIGVCRGMQVILHHFGVALVPVSNHVAVRHLVQYETEKREVNSYHGYGAKSVNNLFEITARSADGVVESVKHCNNRIKGIMWHPEREIVFSQDDIRLFVEFFG